MVFGRRISEAVSLSSSSQDSSDGEEDSQRQTLVENPAAPTHSATETTKPPLAQEVTYTGVTGKNPRGTKNWTCNHCKNSYKSTYTRIHYHFFGPPPGKNSGIQRCTTLLKDREAYERIRRRVQEAEKSGVAASLKCSTISKKDKGVPSKPLEDAFQILERDEVDMKVMRGLCANGIPFNVLRNPQFVEMVVAINNGPKGYKPPSSEKARTVLLDECKRRVDKDLIPVKDTWFHQGVSIVSDGWSNVKHMPLINVLAVNSRAAVFMYADDFSGVAKTGVAIADYLIKAIEEIGPANVLQVVTDNAANCKAAGLEIQKLEKEALVKGVPIGQALDINIPPPRPKRKPSNPYPRKKSISSTTLHSEAEDGKHSSVESSHVKHALDLEKEPLPEQYDLDEGTTIVKDNNDGKVVTDLQEIPCSFVSSSNKSSISMSMPLGKSGAIKDITPTVNEVIARDDTNESNINTKIENQKLEKDDGKQTNVRKLENYDGSQVKLVQNDKTDGLNGKPNHFINLAASNTSESQNNTSSVHQSFLPYPPFTRHKQDDYQSFLQMSSTFSSLIASTLLQNPAAHAAASFAATFWPYENPETSSDSARCSKGDFPSQQICSPPSVEAIAAATVAAASAWWAAHGLLPLCAPLLTAFSRPPASATSVPSMNTSETPAPKAKQAKTTLLDPKYSEAQHLASESPAVVLSDSESGDVKLNISLKGAHHEMNKTISEHLDSNKMKDRKQVDRSSCGSNTTSSNEVETDALEKDEKGDKEPGPETPDANHLATEPSNRRSRAVSNLTDSWKEVSEEGKLAFRALFSRQVLPQSFSPPQDMKDKDHQVENIKNNKQNTDGKDEEDPDSRKFSSNYEGVQKNLPFVENDMGLLTIGLGQAKLKTRRTGFKPYKRCSMEAKENRVGTTTSNQGEEKGYKRIRLEGGVST